jgi:hypothetical protein
MRLAELFASLPQPARGAAQSPTFSVAAIPGAAKYFVARSQSGQPSLLIESDGRSRSPILLQNLAVTFNAQCLFELSSARRAARAVVIECLATDEALKEFFFTIAGDLLEALSAEPTPDEIANAIESLIELFQRLSRPPRREAQGLFGELAVIDAAHDPHALLEVWHNDPFDRFDFAFATARLEIKTSASRRRNHEFSFEQCHPPIGTTATVASLFVETSGGGLSLQSLIERIEHRIARDPRALTKLHAVVADTLGAALPHALGQRYDEQLAFSSLSFFDLMSIPSVPAPLPLEVSGVRFRSDITGCTPMPAADLAARMPAATPRIRSSQR